MQLESEQLLEIPESDSPEGSPKLDELIEVITETNQLLAEAIENQRRQSVILDELIAQKDGGIRSLPTSTFPFSS